MLNSKYIRYHIDYSDYPDNYILRSCSAYPYIQNNFKEKIGSTSYGKIGAVDYGCDNDGKITNTWMYQAYSDYEYGFTICFEI